VRGGLFKNAGKTALRGDRAIIAGTVCLRTATGGEETIAFSAQGDVRFSDAKIEGDFDCSGRFI
jgi:hypothetical protein